MFKKIVSLLAALALCFALLPSQVHASDEPEPPQPPVIEEPVEPDTPPEEPEQPVQPMGGSDEMPSEDEDYH